jgi:hypothetical protein
MGLTFHAGPLLGGTPMRNFILTAGLAAVASVGLAEDAKAQVVVSVGSGGIYPGGGLVYTGGYGYGFSPYYGYTGVYPAGYTLGRTYGLYTYPSYTYGSYYGPDYYSTGYSGGYYRPRYYGRGWRRW